MAERKRAAKSHNQILTVHVRLTPELNEKGHYLASGYGIKLAVLMRLLLQEALKGRIAIEIAPDTNLGRRLA